MLLLAEFTYNFNVYFFTDKTFFEVIYGKNLKSDIIIPEKVKKYFAKKNFVKAKNLAERLRLTREKIKFILAKA